MSASIFTVTEDIPDMEPLGYFTTRERAESYAAELRSHGVDVVIDEHPVDVDRRDLPGAFYVHLDANGAVAYPHTPHFTTGNTPNDSPSWTNFGSEPLPRYIGCGLTAEEAITAANAERGARR